MPAKKDVIVRGIPVGMKKPVDIHVRDGVVQRMGAPGQTPPDFGSEEAHIGPPLFDIQVNGVAGIDLQGAGVKPEDYVRVTECLARWGVMYWVPTLVTGPAAEMEHGCRVFAEAMRDRRVARAVPGLHLEGPHISPEDGPRGAHPKAHVRKASVREFNRMRKAAENQILYVTVAPECPGAAPFIRAAVREGVLVALGHHNASARQIAKAADAGARLCTHLGNGAASMIHRHHNPIWPQLAEDRFYASFIADLHHLPEPVLKACVRAKGFDKTVLTSDCIALAGLKPGKYKFAGSDVELRRDGKVCLLGTDLLAGSAHMLLQGVVNAWRATDLTLQDACACASAVPGRLFGVRMPPALKKGRRMNAVVFEVEWYERRSEPRVSAVFFRGERVFPE